MKKYYIICFFFPLFILFSCATIKVKKNVSIDYFNLGNNYLDIKDYPKAIDSFKKSLEYNPDSKESIINLIISYQLNKNYIEAESLILKNYRKINNEFTKKLIMLLGNNFYLMEKYDQAIKTYNQYKGIYPEESDCYYNLGLTYLKMSNDKEAFYNFSEAFRKNNRHIAAIYNIGDYYYKQKDYKNSLYYFLMLEELDNKNPNVFYRIGDVEFLLEEFELSKKNTSKSIELDQKNYNYYILMAKIYSKGYKDRAKTLEYLENAFKYDFKDLKYLQNTPEFNLLSEFEEYNRLLRKYNIK